MSVTIFFCYAREDEALLNILKTHLRPLQRQGLIEVWYDRDINAGAEWEREIDTQLNDADIILLLVSPDFMDSDYCYSIEMKRAVERHDKGEACVIPVILRPVYWKDTPFGALQVLPTDGKPVTIWSNRDEAFLDIATGIRKTVQELLAPSPSIVSQKTIEQWPEEGDTSFDREDYVKAERSAEDSEVTIAKQSHHPVLSQQGLYQNDPLLILLKDIFHLNDLIVIIGIIVLTVGVLFGLYALAGMPEASLGYYVRAIVQAFVVFPALTWVYFSLPDGIARLFNTLETNKVIGNPQPNPSGAISHTDFLSKLAHTMGNFWWVVGTITFVILYWLFRLLVLSPLTQSSYSLWLQLVNLIIYIPMLYFILLTSIRLLVALVYTNKLFKLFEVRLNPMNPDGSSGLGSVGNMLGSSVFFMFFTGLGALVSNPAYLGANVNIFTLAEAVIISIIYVSFTLIFSIGWLRVPHDAMVRVRDEALQPLAEEIQRLLAQQSSPGNNVNKLKAKQERIETLQQHYMLLLDIYPTWPLAIEQARRWLLILILPIFIPLVLLIIEHFKYLLKFFFA